ncbi:SseB protein N-terminal domain-containing protein [Arthrobacter alpinus]|uniref:SseB protein N-terminal domain-containing protein n=1 Tax=Arthrobacter alpinus TaxID=656366 RepID=A0A1H5JSR2_9MICC|nr:SseB family protein [Arthrobacter alpinus]SEE55643.1 SseB protein N-terminal domain-containing protein [Arthrobacter alpinus]
MTEMPKKALPGHIAAALAGAGGITDSAGQPWAGRDLPAQEKYHNFDADDGAMDAGFAAAMADLAAGDGSEAQVVASLATARVFIPIVAQLAEQTVGENGLVSDKESDMALVTLQGPDGRRALPVFSHAEALARWHREARPVAVYAARAALSAVAEDAQLLVVDPGSQRPFVVRRPAMWALAQQQQWQPSYDDVAVESVLRESVSALGNSAVVDISASAGQGIESLWDHRSDPGQLLVSGGGTGPELCVTITLVPGLDQQTVNELLARLQEFWAGQEYFASAVDSIQIRLRHPQPQT